MLSLSGVFGIATEANIMADKKTILVGKIVAPQGIRGEVRVQTYTTAPEDFKKFQVQSEKFKSDDFKFVRRLNPNSDVIIARIAGYDDRNAAETLRNTELFVARDALPDLDAGEYYQADLIGLDVVRGGKKIGRVACFQNFGGGDIMELDNGDMILFKGADVDFDAKVITVK